ncbi:MAG: hypothetical protein ACYC49_09390 [Ignavibacteriaceae bacterium]
MTNRKSFINNYILSLKERTRNEKKGLQLGFDWIIYNLGIAKNWIPTNLPFFRSISDKDFITKTGAQFGIDMAFLAGNELIIFVLKDEELNNKNWIKNNFDSDLRMASTPELTSYNNKIEKIKIILAYNKDEDDNGVQLYNNLISALPKKIYEDKEINYERWNLSKIVEQVNDNLITPDLLPQHLSALLNYICGQVNDLEYGSEEWENILLPNWKNFLNILLSDNIDEKKLRLIPVSLYIIYNYKKDAPSSYSGWIDLIEWALLAVWNLWNDIQDPSLKQLILLELWHSFYLAELEIYLLANQELFNTEHGISTRVGIGNLGALNDAYLAYWLIGRIGILHFGMQELLPPEERPNSELFGKLVERSNNWINNLLRNNPAAYRPLIDLHHIELYLIWLIIYQSDNKKFLKEWFYTLEARLMVRRIGMPSLPFIEGRNRYELVAEYAATHSTLQKKPEDFVDMSSYLLLMIIELTFSLNEDDREELLEKYYNHLVLGHWDDGKPFYEKIEEIDLQSWVPPDDWTKRIFKSPVTDGIAESTQNFHFPEEGKLSDKIKSFINNSTKQFPDKMEISVPLSSLILACIKNKSPLPPLFWRGTIFPEIFKNANSTNE